MDAFIIKFDYAVLYEICFYFFTDMLSQKKGEIALGRTNTVGIISMHEH